jgi:hypothetical protein
MIVDVISPLHSQPGWDAVLGAPPSLKSSFICRSDSNRILTRLKGYPPLLYTCSSSGYRPSRKPALTRQVYALDSKEGSPNGRGRPPDWNG